MKRRIYIWIALLLATAGPQAVAAPVVEIRGGTPYPSSHDAKVVARWVRDNTSISLADVVVLGKPFLFAATVRARSALNSDILVDLDVHEEVLEPTFANKMHARSARLDVTVRCQDQHILTNALTFYSGANLTGSEDRANPHTGWVEAPAGDFAAELVASACDPGYKRPFASLMRAQVTHVPDPASGSKAISTPSSGPSLAAAPAIGLDPNDHTARNAGPGRTSKPPPSKPRIYSVILGTYSTLQRAESALDASANTLAKYGAANQRVIVESTGRNVLFLAYAGDWETIDTANLVCSDAKQIKLDCETHSK